MDKKTYVSYHYAYFSHDLLLRLALLLSVLTLILSVLILSENPLSADPVSDQVDSGEAPEIPVESLAIPGDESTTTTVMDEDRAEDTGGAVRGEHVDLCVGSHREALELGGRTATVYWE